MIPRRVKIICTLGPASSAPEQVRALISAGMDVARLNFSHGSIADHRARLENVRTQSRELGKPVAVLQDLCGPKIRTREHGPASVSTGQTVYLKSGENGDAETIAIDYDGVHADVRPGDRVMLGDGHVDLRVEGVQGERVECRVEHGGALRSRMGVNLPSSALRVSALTEKDKLDLEQGLQMGVDYVALSFVRKAQDIEQLRQFCEERGHRVPVIAKIETPAAVENLDSIVRASDAVMVARGDLGVELPPEHVPVIQKQIIGTCRLYKTPVIVATEMLESMVEAPRPTRAEASDVAGAVFGGADAVMLSAETATGAYPIGACEIMHRIIRKAENSQFFDPVAAEADSQTPEAIAHAACAIARDLHAKLIVVLTQGGATARFVSKMRPTVPIVAFSREQRTLPRLALFWGVTPHFLQAVEPGHGPNELVQRTSRYLSDAGLLSAGDRYVIVYGAAAGVPGATNTVRVEQL